MFSLKNNKKERQASQFWYMFFQLAKSCVLFFFSFPKHMKLTALCSAKGLWVIFLSIMAAKTHVEKVAGPMQGHPAGYPTKYFANA